MGTMIQKILLTHKAKIICILGLILLSHLVLFFFLSAASFTALVEVEILLAVAGEWITSYEVLKLTKTKRSRRRKTDAEKLMTNLSKKLVKYHK